jgi:hypothetical protein
MLHWINEAYEIHYHNSGQAHIRILSNVGKKDVLHLYMGALREFTDAYKASEPQRLHMIYEMIYIPTDFSLVDKQLVAFGPFTHCAVVCRNRKMMSFISKTVSKLMNTTTSTTRYFTCMDDAHMWLRTLE